MFLSIIRWNKNVFINNNIVGTSPHSCRAVSTSKARAINVSMDNILSRGCWKNRKNLFTFYSKDIINYAPYEIDFNRIFLFLLSTFVFCFAKLFGMFIEFLEMQNSRSYIL